MSRVLIAGCGYVGEALGHLLAGEGCDVYGLRRNPRGLPPMIKPVAADLTDPATLGELPEDLETVFYSASAGAFTPEAYRAAYVDGVDNLLRALALRGAHPGRFFFVSSTGVYGQDHGAWVDEDSPPSANRPTAQALLEGEQRALNGPIPATVVRFSGIYGPGRSRMVDMVRDGTARRYANRTIYLNHIHRDDAARALGHLRQHALLDTCYLGTDDEPVERSEALAWIAGQLGVPAPPWTDDAPKGGRGANRRYRNTRLRDTGFSFHYPTFREGYGSLMEA